MSFTALSLTTETALASNPSLIPATAPFQKSPLPPSTAYNNFCPVKLFNAFKLSPNPVCPTFSDISFMPNQLFRIYNKTATSLERWLPPILDPQLQDEHIKANRIEIARIINDFKKIAFYDESTEVRRLAELIRPSTKNDPQPKYFEINGTLANLEKSSYFGTSTDTDAIYKRFSVFAEKNWFPNCRVKTQGLTISSRSAKKFIKPATHLHTNSTLYHTAAIALPARELPHFIRSQYPNIREESTAYVPGVVVKYPTEDDYYCAFPLLPESLPRRILNQLYKMVVISPVGSSVAVPINSVLHSPRPLHNLSQINFARFLLSIHYKTECENSDTP